MRLIGNQIPVINNSGVQPDTTYKWDLCLNSSIGRASASYAAGSWFDSKFRHQTIEHLQRLFIQNIIIESLGLDVLLRVCSVLSALNCTTLPPSCIGEGYDKSMFFKVSAYSRLPQSFTHTKITETQSGPWFPFLLYFLSRPTRWG